MADHDKIVPEAGRFGTALYAVIAQREKVLLSHVSLDLERVLLSRSNYPQVRLVRLLARVPRSWRYVPNHMN